MGGAADPGREIRLALVLNGGVSLAVWMGGVTHEIDDLRRSSWQFRDECVPTFSAAHGVYHELLAALRTGLRVDVIAGSSAGGINGAALGAAIGARRPLRVSGDRPLRDLWVSVGDFASLMRPITDSKPPSLLRGDDYMLPHMQSAFRSILGTAPPTPLPTRSPSVTTHSPKKIASVIAKERRDATTIRLFVTSTAFRANERRFTDSLGTHFDILDNRLRFRFVRDRWLGRDDFAGSPEDLGKLGSLMGLAARASASFPMAFEPTLLRKKHIPRKSLTLDHDTYAMDGGVLDNEPFDPVLDQITQMPADEGVTRYLAYIVPYPNAERAPKGAAVDPNARDVLMNVASLPRDEGIDRDFDRISNLGVLARTRVDTNTELLLQPSSQSLEALAKALGPKQHARRRAAAGAEIARRRNASGTGLGPNGAAESAYQTFPPLHDAPLDPAAAAPPDASWPHGIAAAERVAQRALAVLRTKLHGCHEHCEREQITEARAVVSRAISEIRSLGIDYTTALRRAPAGDLDASTLYAEGYADRIDAIVESIVGQLERVARTENGQASWRKRLEAIEVISQSLPSGLARSMPPFGLVRMSADCPNALRIADRAKPDQKLSGLQLGHFGGFLKRSWRVNDWIWGRLDGTWHLVHVLLDAERMDDARAANPHLADDLADIAFPDRSDMLPTLVRLWDDTLSADDARKAKRQFVRAFDGPAKDYERCAAAIAARAQLGIVTEELPTLWEEARADRETGWRKDTPRPLPDPVQVSPDIALDQFSAWDGAAAKVEDERATSAFARLAAQAAVVLSTLLATNAGMPRLLRSPFVWMRGVSLGSYLFVRSWFSKRAAGLTVALLLMAAAILTVVVSSAFAAIAVPIAIGTVVIASALLLGNGPTWFRFICTGIGVGAAFVACAFAYHHTGHSYHVDLDAWVVLVVAGAVGFGLGCLAAIWSRARLPVFLLGLAVVCAALIYAYGGTSTSNQNWLVRLLVLATALPFAFGIPALGRALSEAQKSARQEDPAAAPATAAPAHGQS